MPKFEVVLETPLYYSVVVDADDQDEAANIAMDNYYPSAIHLPRGFEAEQDDWFVGGVVRVRDDE